MRIITLYRFTTPHISIKSLHFMRNDSVELQRRSQSGANLIQKRSNPMPINNRTNRVTSINKMYINIQTVSQWKSLVRNLSKFHTYRAKKCLCIKRKKELKFLKLIQVMLPRGHVTIFCATFTLTNLLSHSYGL